MGRPTGDRGRGVARALLGPEGPLARTLPGYEHREGQLAMADAVERALAEGRVLVCEAGTGTGKTLAYLVPAILSGQKVVVSTATKALEEQIVHKDIALIERQLGLDAQAALVKGLGNYVCLRRLAEVRASARPLANPLAYRALPLVEAWARRTETGDVAEIAELGEGDPLWREVASSSETRIGASCPFYDACFVTRMKREAVKARILVVNHHLFFADLALKHAPGRRRPAAQGALPPYDAVIFDEAHQIEEIATQFFGTRVSRARIDAMLRDAERALAAAGLGAETPVGRAARTLATTVQNAADRLFALLAAAHAGRGRASLRARSRGRPGALDARAALDPLDAVPDASTGGEGRVPLPPSAWSGDVLAAYHALDAALEAFEGFAETNALDEAIRLVAQRSALVRDELAAIVDPATHHVTWIEARARSVAIGASPIEVGAILRRAVFEPAGAVVLTSATLTAGRPPSFRFLRSRMGLGGPVAADGDAGEGDSIGVHELSVPSPFAFEERALLYVARDLPDATHPAFLERAAARIRELVGVTGGGAFVLCTSVRAMRGLAEALGGSTPGSLLVQGAAPKGALLERFRREGDAVLVATMSFWEGVDVPGDALRLVVIEKIPFAVPTDPVVAARCAAIEAAGGQPFASYSVPHAAITLKQGFGRLLRTAADRGVVGILDGRIRTRGYGRELLASLPPAPLTESLDEVRAFWARTSAPRPLDA